jgi:hypothetical protein
MTAPDAMHRERPRFTDFRFLRLPNGRCRATVTLAWRDRDPVQGSADGVTSPSGELRCAAEACLRALAEGHPERRFELFGVKSVRAFDATVVIVSLGSGEDHAQRLVGSVLATEDVVRGAALAVLHATNRLITRRSTE